jgi:glycosyltransferase involved in cell wall biosynthesis
MPGRGTRLKGHADAIALLANLRASGMDARLWMPGALQDGREAYLAELEDLAHAAEVEDAVALTETTDDIAGAYAASDLVLQLSRKPESFGRTVIEALSVGRPVLGWAHGGVGELLRELQPQGAVPPSTWLLGERSANLLAHPPVPPATMPARVSTGRHAGGDVGVVSITGGRMSARPGQRLALGAGWVLASSRCGRARVAEAVLMLGATAVEVCSAVVRFRGSAAARALARRGR